jgi:hypothetical protein
MFAVEAFRPRMNLAKKALVDYEEGRYHLVYQSFSLRSMAL